MPEHGRKNLGWTEILEMKLSTPMKHVLIFK